MHLVVSLQHRTCSTDAVTDSSWGSVVGACRVNCSLIAGPLAAGSSAGACGARQAQSTQTGAHGEDGGAAARRCGFELRVTAVTWLHTADRHTQSGARRWGTGAGSERNATFMRKGEYSMLTRRAVLCVQMWEVKDGVGFGFCIGLVGLWLRNTPWMHADMCGGRDNTDKLCAALNPY